MMSVSSLKAQISVGPGVVYGTNIASIGASANASYDITPRISVLGAYGYFFNTVQYADGSNSNWWTLDANASYKCYKTSAESDIFVLSGVNFIYFKSASALGSLTGIYNRLLGANIGVGWKLKMGNKNDLIPEVRYTLGDLNFLRFEVKFMFGI